MVKTIVPKNMKCERVNCLRKVKWFIRFDFLVGSDGIMNPDSYLSNYLCNRHKERLVSTLQKANKLFYLKEVYEDVEHVKIIYT